MDTLGLVKQSPDPGTGATISISGLGRVEHMSEKTNAAMFSRRRVLWLLGVGAPFGLGMPAVVLTASEAEAQTPGMERRQGRRENRRDRRQDRRENRQDRRDNRRGVSQ
jgi:hypothetical protein